jgi:hypothetical protein
MGLSGQEVYFRTTLTPPFLSRDPQETHQGSISMIPHLFLKYGAGSIFMKGIRGGNLTGVRWVWLRGSFFVVLGLCLITVVMPLRLGEKRIYRYELGHYEIG